MLKPYIFIASLSISVILNSCSTKQSDSKNANDSKVILEFNPENGKTYPMLYTLKVHNDTTGDETMFTIELNDKVEKNTDGKIEISSEFEKITMVGNLKGTEVKLIAGDTLKSIPEASLVAAPIFAFLSHKVIAEYTKSFRKVNEKILDADTIKALTDVESKAQFIAQFPEKEVGINDSWESGIEIKVGNKKIEKALFTVKSISATEVMLSVKGDILGKGEKFGHEFTMTGSFTGEISIDKKTGWQNKSALHIQFILEMMGNKTPMKQEISYNLR